MTYRPADGVFIGSPPCAECGAHYFLHGPAAVTRDERRRLANAGRLPCPTPYRETSLERAQARLAEAEASGDDAAIFTARGDVQRLTPR